MRVNPFFNMPVNRRRRIFAWAAISLFLLMAANNHGQTPPPATNLPDPQSMKLLRETLADQARNPGKIIRTYTNLPPQQSEQSQQSPQPQQPQIVSPVEVAPVPIPVYAADTPRTESLSPKAATAAALERQFLDGKLSARQYRKALADLERANLPAKDTKDTAAKPKVSEPAPTKATSRVSTNAVVPQPTERQQKVSEVESRIDEMIRQKEARERAAQTNATTVPTGPLTKRQRLDLLLKQVVEGKLSDQEYKTQRDKILAEPD